MKKRCMGLVVEHATSGRKQDVDAIINVSNWLRRSILSMSGQTEPFDSEKWDQESTIVMGLLSRIVK